MARRRAPVAPAPSGAPDDGWLLHVSIDGETAQETLLRVASADDMGRPARDRWKILKARETLGWDVIGAH